MPGSFECLLKEFSYCWDFTCPGIVNVARPCLSHNRHFSLVSDKISNTLKAQVVLRVDRLQ